MVHAVPGSLFIYAPNKGAPIALAILFAVSGCLHLWQNNLKYRSWRIGFLLPWAATLFVAGFSLRAYAAFNHYDNLNVFIASTVLLFLAPPVYNGANYFVFGNALFYLPHLLPIHPGRVWTTFVALDGIDGIIAGNGASYASNTKNTRSQRESGVRMVKASLLLLIAMFLGFVSLVVLFHIRAKRAGVFNYRIKVIVYELYASSLFILLRNCFRTASFFYSWDSVANGEEWPFWVLEVLPMLLNTYMMNVFPPAKYLPKNTKIYLAVDGKTELEGPGMADKRSFIVTLFDPFDLVGLVTGRDNKNRFWEKDGIGGPKELGAQEIQAADPKKIEEGEVKY